MEGLTFHVHLLSYRSRQETENSKVAHVKVVILYDSIFLELAKKGREGGWVENSHSHI